MRDFFLVRSVLVLVVGVVLLAGCGGGDDDPTVQGGPDDEQTAADEPGSGDAGEAGSDDAGEAGDGDDGSSPAQGRDFAELASQGFSSASRVTYEVATSGEATQTLVLSSDGQQTAWLMPEARMIMRGDDTQIFCDESAQQAQCFDVSGQAPAGAMAGAAPFLGLATSFQGGVESFPGFVSTGEREIAGRTAACGTFDASRIAAGDNGEATLCVDAETGVMLSYEATGPQAGTSSLEAVEVGEPQDSDFEPPAEPMSMDDLTNQGG